MTPDSGSAYERLLAAASALHVPPAVTEAWAASAPEPVAGQLWRARWEDDIELVVLVSVGDTDVVAAPLTFDILYADDTALVLEADDSDFATPVVIWPALRTRLPMFVLDRMAGVLSQGSAGLYADADSSGAGPGRHGAAIVNALDARSEYRERLADTMLMLASANWAPQGTGGLADLLREKSVAPKDLAPMLDITPQAALGLRRGQAAITRQQAETLAVHVGQPWEELLASNPSLPQDLVLALDRPAHRSQVQRAAQALGLSEADARRTVGYDLFALAARQTGPGHHIAWDSRLDRYFEAVLDE
jgi:plasmid maintenance system antidote protein VapI